VIHHLVVDGVSWRLLLQDLASELGTDQAALPDGSPTVRPQGLSYRRWSRRLERHATSEAVRAELPFWLEQDAGARLRLPRDLAGGEPTEASARTLLRSLEVATTRELLDVAPAAYRTRAEDLLVTALIHAVGRWSGHDAVLVELEGHGREQVFEDLDPSHTVGWFTALYPLLLAARESDGTAERIKATKEALRRVPQRGLHFGVLRYTGADEDRRRLAALPRPELGFNYLGRLGTTDTGGLEVLIRPVGSTRDPAARRALLLTVTAGVFDGRLEITWTYSAHVHREATMARLADAMVEDLVRLIAHCAAPETGGATPSDFPESGLDQAGLDDFLADLGGVSVEPSSTKP
ncbi:MAG: non-ribosomal peptide synthetase, partial [Acidobacteria bacterium]|nr:non-ribosomal peptide synthetase [Acidobacteriota bacterium]